MNEDLEREARLKALELRTCRLMVWEDAYARALAENDVEALVVEMLDRLEAAGKLIDQLECLAVDSHPSLYAAAQRWKAGER